MKKFMFLTLFASSSLFALPAWQFAIDACFDGEECHIAEQMPSEAFDECQSVVSYVNTCNLWVVTTCHELWDGEISYSAEVWEQTRSDEGRDHAIKATVTAPVGEDATITFSASAGEITISFSSKI